MKKYVVLTALLFGFASAQAQYLQTAQEGRVWYSSTSGGMFVTTSVYAVGPKMIFNGQLRPLLVLKNQNLITTDTLGVIIEDTALGTLTIDFFDSQYFDVSYDFRRSIGDTFSHPAYSGGSLNLTVDSVYSITDFRGVTRLVQVIEVGPQSFGQAHEVEIVEGIGPRTSLIYPYHDMSVSDVPSFNLRCVQDGGTKIYGQNTSPCYLLSEDEHPVVDFDLYPNPAQNQIFVEGLSPDEWGYAKIYNLQGQCVLELEMTGLGINVQKLSSGSYFLVLQNDKGETAKATFVKQ